MTCGRTTRLSIATGGDPRAALAAATIDGIEAASVNVVEVAHDDGCPSPDGAGLAACTCEILVLTLERVA